MSLGGALLREMRPQQWVKNAFVLAPAVFAGPALLAGGELTAARLLPVAAATIGYCLASSATYILNDISDVEADRRHPVKCKRPIASGELPVPLAWRAFGALLLLAAVLAVAAGGWVWACLLAYFAMNLAYSNGLKQVAYVDAVVISLGFVLRILAGGEAAGVHLSQWLIASTVLLSLFLALGKRHHELLTSPPGSRKSLDQYDIRHVRVLMWFLGVATPVVWLLYTLDPETMTRFATDKLWWTAPFPLVGLLRFARLASDASTAHSPTERMLKDPAFVANLLVWTALTGALLYPGLA
jgi:decaprenyl-phosphate phosphoribosyltransferase